MNKRETIIISGEVFKISMQHFAFKTLYKTIENMEELKKLKAFSSLQSVSLNGTNINDKGLKYLAECRSISNINLTFTEITDAGIAHLTVLTHLQHLRLKDTLITAKSIPHFNKMLQLTSLQVHETKITGKDMLALNLPLLKELFLDCEDKEGHKALLMVSKQMPNCEIFVKGKGRYFKGNFEGW